MDLPHSPATFKSKKLKCSDCGKEYLSKRGLQQHKVRKHNAIGDEKPFECSYCDRKFWIAAEREAHTRTHTGEQPFACSECGAQFAHWASWRRHVRQVHGPAEKSYECSIHECGKVFKNADSLRVHTRKHSDMTQKCPTCDKTYADRTGLSKHLKFKHEGHGLEHACSYCIKEFQEAAKLREHIRIHTGEEPFPCSMCPMTFSISTQLRCHEAGFHPDERTPRCSLCAKTFTSRSGLRKHMETHKASKERLTFPCTICEKKLADKSSLRGHIAAHKNERKHSCSYCGASFVRSGALNLHIRTHTGERPHACSMCQRRFVTSGQRRTHESIVHRGERRHIAGGYS